jgi:hypothetical protein
MCGGGGGGGLAGVGETYTCCVWRLRYLPKIKAWIEEHGGGMMIPFSVEFEENKWGLKDAGAEAMTEFMKDKEGAHMLPRIIKQVRG